MSNTEAGYQHCNDSEYGHDIPRHGFFLLWACTGAVGKKGITEHSTMISSEFSNDHENQKLRSAERAEAKKKSQIRDSSVGAELRINLSGC